MLRCVFVISSRSFSAAATAEKIGIIGLGQVGNAITKNFLNNKYNIECVYDKDSSKFSALPPEVKKAGSCREVTEKCDVIFTALPHPASIKDAAEEDNGILAAMKEGKTWIDHSSTDYEQTLRFAAAVKNRGGDMLEAPITGGLAALRKGQMTVYLGGDEDIAHKFMPHLKCSFQSVVYLGSMGKAQITKIATNMLCASHLVAMGEMLMLAKKSGIDLKTYWDAVRLSAGNSFVWETAGPVIFKGTFEPEFAIKLFCKDLNLGYNICKNKEVPIPLHSLVQAMTNHAMYKYGEEAGCYVQPKILEDACKENLQQPGFENWTYGIEHNEGSSIIKHKF